MFAGFVWAEGGSSPFSDGFVCWVWVGFGWRLGGVWVGVGWLDLGPVVVPLTNGFDGGFRCLLGLFGQRVGVCWRVVGVLAGRGGNGVCWVCVCWRCL